ncbi:MAG: TIM-barrel domain-containing protein [Hyphomicrobiales bacterium]
MLIGERPIELRLTELNPQMLRVTILELRSGDRPEDLLPSPELVVTEAGRSIATIRALSGAQGFAFGTNRVRVSPNPLTIVVTDAKGRDRQTLRFAPDGRVDFALGEGPIFGLGQGGRQFDRRGGLFQELNGQGEGVRAIDMNAPGARAPEIAFDLAGEGARITIPWIVSADGFATYFARPTGSFDLTGPEGRLTPGSDCPALPVDAFLIVSDDPAEIVRQYALLTGFPHLPPLWSLGYLQSHRTLASRDEVLAEAREFRARQLPCDGMIYLGTGFCPDGWNTGHGAFAFNPRIFPDPEEMVRLLHEDGMRVVLHVVDPPLDLHGAIGDAGAKPEDVDHATNYWARHQPALAAGIDGWWPDVGDRLRQAARLSRSRMYWDGSLASRPDRRPFALHRNAYAGIQRHGWLWSGDIDSAWRTLAMQVPAGLNCGLTGIPFWGTDTGGFITTKELTGELFVRWFQYSSFCPSFRGHGRTWKLRLPWGWNTGEFGPEEFDFRRVELPDPSELHNGAVEPICKTYLELRYKLLPYSYSAVRETSETGMPVMRALWLHYPDDREAVACGDAYLWGRDILVAPVTEKGAASRDLYLPKGDWYDFWTGELVSGGRRITRPVDLETLPLYVRGGAIIPTGPVKQSASEASDQPLVLTIHPGRDGNTILYEDDGVSLGHGRGDWQKFALDWNDGARRLRLSLTPGSRPMSQRRDFVAKIHNADRATTLTFNGEPLEVSL